MASGETVLLKCVVLGTSNVGKTSLLGQYVHATFDPRRRVTTGADFASKVVVIGDEEVRLVIWDTAGQERFHHGTLGGAFYRGADAALLVYDTTDIRSFEQIEMWRNELLQRIDGPPDEFPIVVVGNKMDLPNPNRATEEEAVRDWCRSLGVGLCLTSAKDGACHNVARSGVTVAMEALAMLALENKRRRAPNAATTRPTISLDSGTLGTRDAANRSNAAHKSGGACC